MLTKNIKLLSVTAIMVLLSGCGDTGTGATITQTNNGNTNNGNSEAVTTFTNKAVKGSLKVTKTDYGAKKEVVSITSSSVNMCNTDNTNIAQKIIQAENNSTDSNSTDSNSTSGITLTDTDPVKNLNFNIKVNNCYSNFAKLNLNLIETTENGNFKSKKSIIILNPEYNQKDVYSYKFADPLYKYQWYLNNFGQDLYPISLEPLIAGHDIDMNNINGITGKNIKVAVIGDGIDMFHPDLKNNIDINDSYNYYNNSHNTTPYGLYDEDKTYTKDTLDAGIIAAQAQNSIGITGIAPDSKIISLNPVDKNLKQAFYDNRINNLSEFNYFLNALSRITNITDIAQNGYNLNTKTLNSLINKNKNTLDLLIHKFVMNARNSKGGIFVKSSGDDGNNANANFNALENNPEIIVTGTLNQDNKLPSYAVSGANILVSAYGGDKNSGIVTTDLAGKSRGIDNNKLGYNNHLNVKGNENYDYTNTYGSDLASAEVSGVIALMLEANPKLTYRDIAVILAKTARKNNPNDNEWQTNGAGLYFNYKYGFGLIDAQKAVKMAKTFKSIGNGYKVINIQKDINLDQNATALQIPFTINTDNDTVVNKDTNNNIKIRTVSLNLNIDADKNKIYQYQNYYDNGINDKNMTYYLYKGNNIFDINTDNPITVNVYKKNPDGNMSSIYTSSAQNNATLDFNISESKKYVIGISNDNNETNASKEINATWTLNAKTPLPSSQINNIQISLISPSGTKDLLVKTPNSLNQNDEYNNTRITTTHLLDENPNGQWYINIKSSDGNYFHAGNIHININGYEEK